jgi:4'-phosphopantetheinyl transferase
VYFNTARSEDDWVCAISRQAEVGVDVERVRELPELDALIRAYCAEREQLALRALSSARSALARNFLQCWTRKEAVLKALGAGLSIPPNQIDVFSDDEETEVMAQGRRWRVCSLGAPSADGAGEVMVALACAVTAHAP